MLRPKPAPGRSRPGRIGGRNSMLSRGWRRWWQRRSKRRSLRTSACRAAIEPLEDRYVLAGGSSAAASLFAAHSPGMQSKAPALAQPSDGTVRDSDVGPSARTQAPFTSSNDQARTDSNDSFFLHLNRFQYQTANDGYVSHENL